MCTEYFRREFPNDTSPVSYSTVSTSERIVDRAPYETVRVRRRGDSVNVTLRSTGPRWRGDRVSAYTRGDEKLKCKFGSRDLRTERK